MVGGHLLTPQVLSVLLFGRQNTVEDEYSRSAPQAETLSIAACAPKAEYRSVNTSRHAANCRRRTSRLSWEMRPRYSTCDRQRSGVPSQSTHTLHADDIAM